MHDHIVRGKDLVDRIYGDRLGPVCGAGCVKPCRFVIDMFFFSDNRVFRRALVHVILQWHAGWSSPSAAAKDATRPETRHFQGLVYRIGKKRVINKEFRPAVLQQERKLARRKPVVYGAIYGASLVAGQVTKQKFRTVEEYVHDDIILFQPVSQKSIGQPVGVFVKLPVSPCLAGIGAARSLFFPVARHIAQKTIQPCCFVFKRIPETFHIVCKCHPSFPFVKSLNKEAIITALQFHIFALRWRPDRQQRQAPPCPVFWDAKK